MSGRHPSESEVRSFWSQLQPDIFCLCVRQQLSLLFVHKFYFDFSMQRFVISGLHRKLTLELNGPLFEPVIQFIAGGHSKANCVLFIIKTCCGSTGGWYQ